MSCGLAVHALGGGLGDVLAQRLRECLRSLALGLLDVLADCAQRHIVLLGDLRVGQPAVEVVGHQLLDASPAEPHQEAALLEVRPWLGWPASSHRRLQRASGRHQCVAVSGVSLQDLRHIPLTRTLGSSRAAEGLFVLGRGHPLGSRPHPDAMHEGRELLNEGWVYSAGCGGSCSTHNPRPVPPEARGVAGRDVADCARGEGGGSASSSAP